MRILLTNFSLKARTGAEVATRDLALAFHDAGHEVAVYSPNPGEISEELLRAGISFTADLDAPGAIPFTPDIIHGHHYCETVRALLRFPDIPAIFVLHDPTAWHDVPPLSPQIRRYVAVDYNCHARLTARYLIPESQVRVIYNAFDPRLFPPRENVPEKISRALVFSNYATPGSFVEPIKEACAALAISVDVIGSGMNNTHVNPGEVLRDYDLVFAIGRCAIEASITGLPVIVAGTAGLGPFATTRNIAQLFGRDYPYVPATKELIIAEIKKTNPRDALALAEQMRATRSLPIVTRQYLDLYAEVLADPIPAGIDTTGAMLRSTAEYLKKAEFQIRQYTGEDFNTRLPATASRKLTLCILDCPRVASFSFTAHVELENLGEHTLPHAGPFPVTISYHWLAPDGKILVAEGRRTALPQSLKPGGNQQYRIRIDLPETTGPHRLRVTLVQEHVMWFDTLKPPLYADTTVEIKQP